ncbi:unnamed protein product [Caenorhabditis brenneri]
MEPFPLFKLPYLAFKHVIVRLDFIKFAMCSAKCYQIVKSMKLKVRELKVNYTPFNHGLELQFRPCFMYYWHFKSWNFRMTAEEGEQFRINRSTYPAPITPDLTGSRDNIEAVEYLVTFVTDLFKIEHICFEMNADAFTNFQEYFLDRIVNRKVVCDHLIFSAFTLRNNYSLPYHMKNEDVHFILDSLPDDIELSFDGKFEDHFEYKKLLTQKKISTHSGKWMTSEQFLYSNFQKLTVWNDSSFTLKDYNLFMKKWLEHELSEDFHYIFMEMRYDLYEEKWYEDEKHLNVLLDGLDVKEYDHTRNLDDYPRAPVLSKCHKLFDIHRDDGMVASLSLEDRFFKFRSWIPGKKLKTASDLVEQGHVRIGTKLVTDPAFMVTRASEDMITWTNASKIKRHVMDYNNTRDDFDLMD